MIGRINYFVRLSLPLLTNYMFDLFVTVTLDMAEWKHVLYDVYANIYPSDLQLNYARLRTPYDTNHPIKTLSDQVETAVEYAVAGNTPYSSEQVVSIAFQLVFRQVCLSTTVKYGSARPLTSIPVLTLKPSSLPPIKNGASLS